MGVLQYPPIAALLTMSKTFSNNFPAPAQRFFNAFRYYIVLFKKENVCPFRVLKKTKMLRI